MAAGVRGQGMLMQDQGHERSGSGEEEHGVAKGQGLPVGG